MGIRTLTGRIHVGGGQRVGPLTVFPLWSDAPPAVVHLAGAVAPLTISECPQPQVARLLVTNPSDAPVLLLEGETLRGGQQDRVMTATHLLAPRSATEVPVACVEQGRWGHTEDGLHRAGHSTPTLRARNGCAVAGSRRAGGWAADQHGIWQEVERLRSVHQAPAPTSSLHDVDAHARTAASRVLPRPLDGQRGVILGFGGAIRGLDLFASSSDLAAYWEPLLFAALLEAEGSTYRPVSSRLARSFVRKLVRLPFEAQPALALGRDLRASSTALAAAALSHDDQLLHLAAFNLAMAA